MPGWMGCVVRATGSRRSCGTLPRPFREAVEAGRYAGRSIALQGDTLRHLGFLGGRAPAVPGLAPTCFGAAPETVIAFADGAAEPPHDSLDGAARLSPRPGAERGRRRRQPRPALARPRRGERPKRRATKLPIMWLGKESQAAEQPGARDRAPREARSQASGGSARRLREMNEQETALVPRGRPRYWLASRLQRTTTGGGLRKQPSRPMSKRGESFLRRARGAGRAAHSARRRTQQRRGGHR